MNRYGKPSDQCRNLYRFIRLVLGEEISDREIARRWGLDEKNLRELKQGLRVVPKLDRLVRLAEVLEVHRYYVLEVATGMPAEKVFGVLRDSGAEQGLRGLDRRFLGELSVPLGQPSAAWGGEWIAPALQAAALAAHRTLEPDRIFPLVSKELKKFDFESHVFFLDPGTHSASIRHSSFNPRLLHAAEALSGLSLASFRFPLDRVPPLRTVMDARHPLFLPDASVLLGQILGERPLKRLIQHMKKIFRILEVVLTPILLEGEVRGVFATGRMGELDESCLPAMHRFSDDISSSFENAVLFQQVRQSEARLIGLFQKLPEGVFQCDGSGSIVQINLAGARILGFSAAGDPVGRSIHDFGLLNPGAQAVRKQAASSRGTTVRNVVGVAGRRDGSSFLADVTVCTEHDRKGAWQGSAGVFRDIGRLTHS